MPTAAGAFFAAGKVMAGPGRPVALAPEKLQEAAQAPTDILFTCDRPGADETETFHLSKQYFEISS
jgi:hypothetical protein